MHLRLALLVCILASPAFAQPIMTRESFLELADTFRSPHLWKREGGEWKLRHAVWMEGA